MKLPNQNFIFGVWLFISVLTLVWFVCVLIEADVNSQAQSLAEIVGSGMAAASGLLAVAAAYLTIREVRRQTELPIKTAVRDKLLTQLAGIRALQSELRVTVAGIERLKVGAIQCLSDSDLARARMPFWLHFPKVFDLRETTVAEIGVDFGDGGIHAITAVREKLRILLRINHTIPRDAIGYTSTRDINEMLRLMVGTCDKALGSCNRLNNRLASMRTATQQRITRAEADLEAMTTSRLPFSLD